MRTAWCGCILILSLLLSAAGVCSEPFDVDKSSQPIGSPFFRHLAFDYDLDLKFLAKMENRGFGRSEAIAIVLISKSTSTELKDIARRRYREQIHLKDMAEEVGLDYMTVMKNAKAIKEGIEAKGDKNLPPPIYEPTPSPTPARKAKKGKKKIKESPSASETPTASPTPTPTETEDEFSN